MRTSGRLEGMISHRNWHGRHIDRIREFDSEWFRSCRRVTARRFFRPIYIKTRVPNLINMLEIGRDPYQALDHNQHHSFNRSYDKSMKDCLMLYGVKHF